MARTGVFAFDSNNLGDAMQSLSVLSHLASVDTFVDRDRMADFQIDLAISRRIYGTGEIRLRLGYQTFDLPVLRWTDHFVPVSVPTFPGFSKLRFRVESASWKTSDWHDEGYPNDLARPPQWVS